MRRRLDTDNGLSRLGRPRITADHGFRLLARANDNQSYYLEVPEPPRAPEPYKISGASSSMARAHRRSSFVILAGGELGSRSTGGSPLHERTRSPLSPSRLHGRASPFRPRGFKGPPPHASRPPTPPAKPRRFIQPQSLSQGSSPRKHQSLIPQFRGNSMAFRNNSKPLSDRDRWERRSGRRVTKIPRSSSLKAPAKRTIVEATRATKQSIKPVGNRTTPVIVDKKANRSPTKIPIRHASSGRFIQLTKPDKSMISTAVIRDLPPIPSAIPGPENVSTSVATEVTNSPQGPESNPGLVDLLKQASGGSGTSHQSVVSATTATAVQPLRIDATTVLSADVEKSPENVQEEPLSMVAVIVPIEEKNPEVPMKIEPMSVEAVIETAVEIEKCATEMNEKSPLEEKTVENIAEVLQPTVASSALGQVSEFTSTSVTVNNPQPPENLRTGSETSLKSSNGVSTGSVESVRSTDTGVSVNTVRGVSSAREKRGTHVVKKPEIETLSGNVMHLEKNQRNGEPAVERIVEEPEVVSRPKVQGFLGWKNSLVQQIRDRWAWISSKMRFSGCRQVKKSHQTTDDHPPPSISRWSRLRTFCCRKIRHPKIGPVDDGTSCCRPKRGCDILCKPSNWCRWPSCCSCTPGAPQRNRSIRAKHSLTSVAPPPLSEDQKSKIPDVLIEHNSVMRGAIPCLPVPLAWFCLIWNVFLPGSGTIWSGVFNLCTGQPRFAATANPKSRFGAFIVDVIVGVSQLFTVLFCLVGWGWSIWWGVTMVRLARKWKRYKAAEAASSDPEARGNEGSVLPTPGVPTQSLRGIERAR